MSLSLLQKLASVGGGGSANVTLSLTPPASPANGDLWAAGGEGYPDSYGIPLQIWDAGGTSWEVIGQVRRDGSNNILGMITIGPDGVGLMEHLNPGTNSNSTFMTYDGQLYSYVTDGAGNWANLYFSPSGGFSFNGSTLVGIHNIADPTSAQDAATMNYVNSKAPLPVWMFDASDSSDPDPGCFTTDASLINATGLIRLSLTDQSGSYYGSIGAVFAPDTLIYLTNLTTGVVASFQVPTFTVTGTSVDLTGGLGSYSGQAVAWSGKYALSFAPNQSNLQVPLSYVAGNLLAFSTLVGIPQATDSGYAVADIVAAAVAAVKADPTALAAIIAAAGITPVADGNVNPLVSLSTVTGIVTYAGPS